MGLVGRMCLMVLVSGFLFSCNEAEISDASSASSKIANGKTSGVVEDANLPENTLKVCGMTIEKLSNGRLFASVYDNPNLWVDETFVTGSAYINNGDVLADHLEESDLLSDDVIVINDMFVINSGCHFRIPQGTQSIEFLTEELEWVEIFVGQVAE